MDAEGTRPHGLGLTARMPVVRTRVYFSPERFSTGSVRIVSGDPPNVDGGDLSSSGSPSKSRRLSFKGLGTKVATQMLGPDGTKALAPLAPPSSARSSSVIRCSGPGRSVAAGRAAGQTARLDRVRLPAPDGADQHGSRGR